MRKATLTLTAMLVTLLTLPIHITRAEQAQDGSAPAPITKDRGRPVIVAGGVQEPTRIVLARRVRLQEALSVSGGLKKGAKGIVQLIHSDGTFETLRFRNINGKELKANPYLQPGDVISVF